MLSPEQSAFKNNLIVVDTGCRLRPIAADSSAGGRAARLQGCKGSISECWQGLGVLGQGVGLVMPSAAGVKGAECLGSQGLGAWTAEGLEGLALRFWGLHIWRAEGLGAWAGGLEAFWGMRAEGLGGLGLGLWGNLGNEGRGLGGHGAWQHEGRGHGGMGLGGTQAGGMGGLGLAARRQTAWGCGGGGTQADGMGA